MQVPLGAQQRNRNAGGASVRASLPDLASATVADSRVGDMVVLILSQQHCRAQVVPIRNLATHA
eukprot:3515785-Amphidinium_carterae.1